MDFVRTHIAAVLKLPDPGVIDTKRPLRDLGFESLTAIELRNRLSGATDLRLPPGLVFQHPTAEALATYLRSALRRSIMSRAGTVRSTV